MFCKNCGKEIKNEQKFCTSCGNPTAPAPDLDQKWWLRIAKVIYVSLYLPLLVIIPLVWSENTPYYSSYSNQYIGSFGEAFWYSLLTLVIYMVSARLIKVTFFYIAFAQKPQWKKEFKRFF